LHAIKISKTTKAFFIQAPSNGNMVKFPQLILWSFVLAIRKRGYPPHMRMLATETVLKQAELIADEMTRGV